MIEIAGTRNHATVTLDSMASGGSRSGPVGAGGVHTPFTGVSFVSDSCIMR